MKNTYLFKRAWIIVLAFMVTLNACDDDSDANNGQVELLSFGPSGVTHGETIQFIGNNLDAVTAIVLAPNLEIPASAFASQSASIIELVIPEQAESGKVVLKTPQGDIESKTVLSFEVPVEITSISPMVVKPGNTITITGSKVNWIEEIIFADEVSVTEFQSASLTELVVVVPFEAETGKLTFITGGTEPLVLDSEEELEVIVPTITSFSPTSLRHEETLTIEGTDLDLVTGIQLSGTDVIAKTSFVSQTADAIQLEVPATATKGTFTLFLASTQTITSADMLTIILPRGTSIDPIPAYPGVDDLTITGTNLDLVASLKFQGVETPVEADDFVSQSATEIVVPIPAGATPGSISYTTIHGYSGSLGVSLNESAPLDYYIYADGLQNGWQEWNGWGHSTRDFNNTEEVFKGTKAIKMVFTDQYGAIQFGSPSATVFNGYTKLSFRIYAPAPQNLILQIGNNADSYLSIPGGWSLVEVNLSSLAGNGNVSELRIKNNNANLPVTLYIDEVGLKL
jgi:hypothetical protein